MFMPKQSFEGFFQKRCYEKFRRIYISRSELESLFLVSSCEFCEIFKNSTRRLLLIIPVSIKGKGVLPNETVNCDTKTKAYTLT